MLDRELQLLDMRCFIGRDDEGVVDAAAQGAPALAEQRDHADALGARRLRRPHHIGALAAGRVQHEQISRSHQRLHLPREDRLEPDIVGARGETGEGGPRLLGGGGCHPAPARTSAGRSPSGPPPPPAPPSPPAPRSSSAVPTTTKSAPARRAARACSGLRIPPPTNSVTPGTPSRQARITSADTGRGAPLPASR